MRQHGREWRHQGRSQQARHPGRRPACRGLRRQHGAARGHQGHRQRRGQRACGPRQHDRRRPRGDRQQRRRRQVRREQRRRRRAKCFRNSQPFTASGNTGWDGPSGQCENVLECDGVVTGASVSKVVVGDGRTCTLINSTVTGDVRVGQAAYFEVSNTGHRWNRQGQQRADGLRPRRVNGRGERAVVQHGAGVRLRQLGQRQHRGHPGPSRRTSVGTPSRPATSGSTTARVTSWSVTRSPSAAPATRCSRVTSRWRTTMTSTSSS